MPYFAVIWRRRIFYQSLFSPPKFRIFDEPFFSIGAMEEIRSRFFFEAVKICEIFAWFQQHHFLFSHKILEQKTSRIFHPNFLQGTKIAHDFVFEMPQYKICKFPHFSNTFCVANTRTCQILYECFFSKIHATSVF